jgi:hypothetical protein
MELIMTTINLGNLTISNSQILNFSTDEIKASVKKFLEEEFLKRNFQNVKKQEIEIDCGFNKIEFVETLREIKSGKAFKTAKPISDLFDKMNNEW